MNEWWIGLSLLLWGIQRHHPLRNLSQIAAHVLLGSGCMLAESMGLFGPFSPMAHEGVPSISFSLCKTSTSKGRIDTSPSNFLALSRSNIGSLILTVCAWRL